MLSLAQRATNHPQRTAILSDGTSYSYEQLLDASARTSLALLNGQDDLQEARVAFMVNPGFDYVRTQWGIWRAGGVAVPLCINYPLPSLAYVIEDAQAAIVVAGPEYYELLAPYAQEKSLRLLRSDALSATSGTLPDVSADRRAMILYTSGTTGQPKGVVTTHRALNAQITALTDAWEWQADDHILNVLPLHHVHGIINVTSCALWSGACCQFLPKFSPEVVFDVFLEGQVNVFMAVPTIYYKLIAYWESLSNDEQHRLSERMREFRLMVSGSAALPVSVMEQWQGISGQTLLERYGMTEIGMAISNPYRGERVPGHIGQPLPRVMIRLNRDDDAKDDPAAPGEIQIKGPNVFAEYWNRPEATAAAFTDDGWFRSGDVAVLDEGSYRILGRNSVDIIKSGGYKISALEIEEVLRTHPQVQDGAVVGLPDEEWGEVVAACLVAPADLDTAALTAWLGERLPRYKTPRRFLVRDELPRNAMGKGTKPAVKELFV